MQLHHVKHNYIIVYVNMLQCILFEVLQILDFKIYLADIALRWYAICQEFHYNPFLS